MPLGQLLQVKDKATISSKKDLPQRQHNSPTTLLVLARPCSQVLWSIFMTALALAILSHHSQVEACILRPALSANRGSWSQHCHPGLFGTRQFPNKCYMTEAYWVSIVTRDLAQPGTRCFPIDYSTTMAYWASNEKWQQSHLLQCSRHIKSQHCQQSTSLPDNCGLSEHQTNGQWATRSKTQHIEPV